MITRLEVDGFKSLRGFAMDLEPFTVMVGPNGAGKSNVLEALALLSRLTTMSIPEAFKQGRGRVRDQFSRHGDQVAETMTFQVDFLIVGTFLNAPDFREHTRWRYLLRLERRMRNHLEQLVVHDESLSTILDTEDSWARSHPELEPWIRYGRAQRHFLIDRPQKPSTPSSASVTWPTHRFDLSLEETKIGLRHLLLEETTLAVSDLQRIRFLSPDSIHVSDSSEETDAYTLAQNGANLPAVLAALGDEAQGAIRADLVSLIPGVASFEVTRDEDQGAVRLDLILANGERLPARLSSGGTMRILALLAARRMSPRAPIICLEEPENGVFPARLRSLMRWLQQETSEHEDEDAFRGGLPRGGGNPTGVFLNLLATQILLTTHSPVALAALRSEPQHLRFIDMVIRDGWRVSRARAVAPQVSRSDASRLVSIKEIDRLLHAVQTGEEGA